MNAAPNRNVARRGMLWFCTVAMLLFIGLMAFAINQDGWHTPQVALMAICAAVILGLILTLVNASRFWWAMRVVTFIIFSLSFSYVIYEGFFHRRAFGIANAGAPSLFNAVRAFLIFGLPSLLYTLLGEHMGEGGRH